jgi:NTP pyrophosphatase (non-canonical NTP hydrolase)
LGKIKKMVKGDDGKEKLTTERKEAIADEMGDVLCIFLLYPVILEFLWMIIAKNNLKKLKSRKKRGLIKGNGIKR